MDVISEWFQEDYKVIEKIEDEIESSSNTMRKQSGKIKSYGKFQLRIFPSTETQKNFCWIDIMVAYLPGYPQVIPNFQILETSKGIKEESREQVYKIIKDKASECANESMPWIYSLIDELTSYLQILNLEQSSYSKEQNKVEEEKKEVNNTLDKEKIQKQCVESKRKKMIQRSSTKYQEEKVDIEQQRKIEMEMQKIMAAAQWRRSLLQLQQKNNCQVEDSKLKGKLNYTIESSESKLVDEENSFNWSPILNTAVNQSRYKIDFEELEQIGSGGYGRVFRARHKIDRNVYAIKKIKLYRINEKENERIIREVTVISRLQNQFIVRYFQAWVEVVTDQKELEALMSSDDEEEDEEDEVSERDIQEMEDEFAEYSGYSSLRNKIKAKIIDRNIKKQNNQKEQLRINRKKSEVKEQDSVENKNGKYQGPNKKKNQNVSKKNKQQRKSIEFDSNSIHFLNYEQNNEISKSYQHSENNSINEEQDDSGESSEREEDDEEEEEEEEEEENIDEEGSYYYYDEEVVESEKNKKNEQKESQEKQAMKKESKKKEESKMKLSVQLYNVQKKGEFKKEIRSPSLKKFISEEDSESQYYDAKEDQIKKYEESNQQYYSSRDKLEEESQSMLHLNKVEIEDVSSSSLSKNNNKEIKNKQTLSNQSDQQIKQTRVLYIQMEYCAGDTLRNFIDKNPGKEQDKQKWKIFCQIVEALNYLHNQGGLIHRDLKPLNVFLDKNNNVKLGDFGLAVHHHYNHHTYNNQGKSSLNYGNSSSSPKLGSSLLKMEKLNSKQEHSVGIGTPFYMAPEQQKGKGKYSFEVDMYSLGLIFFEMWCNFTTGQEKMKAFDSLKTNNAIPLEYEKIIPKEAQLIILWLLKPIPSERPSTLTLLQSELLPPRIEDEVFKKFILQIGNHRSIESFKLMNFLMKRQTPKNIDLVYDWEDQFSSSLTQKQRGGRPGQNINTQLNYNQVSDYLQNMSDIVGINKREYIAKTRINWKLREVFFLHGAVDLEIPILAPVQDSCTIYISLRQTAKAQQYVSRRESHEQEINNHKHSHEEEEDEEDEEEEEEKYKEDIISTLEIDLVNTDKLKIEKMNNKREAHYLLEQEENVRQRVVFLNYKQISMRYKYLDSIGIALSLNSNLQENFARYISRINLSGNVIKRYHIGQVYNTNNEMSNTSAVVGHQNQQRKEEMNENSRYEASFDIAWGKQYSNIFNSGDDLIYEVEVLKVCEQVASKLSNELGGKSWYIRINSTEILDGIFQECNISLYNRIPVLRILSQFESKAWSLIKKELLDCIKENDKKESSFNYQFQQQLQQNNLNLMKLSSFHFSLAEKIEKMGELLRLKGPIKDIEQKLKNMKGIRKIDRFSKIIEYFRIMKKYLYNFDMKEIGNEDLQGGTFIFDFGLVLQEQEFHHSGMFFKVSLVKVQKTQINISEETPEVIAPSRLQKQEKKEIISSSIVGSAKTLKEKANKDTNIRKEGGGIGTENKEENEYINGSVKKKKRGGGKSKFQNDHQYPNQLQMEQKERKDRAGSNHQEVVANHNHQLQQLHQLQQQFKELNKKSSKKKKEKKDRNKQQNDEEKNQNKNKNCDLSFFIINNQWSQINLETIAIGGRYDNVAAHYQFVKDDSRVPVLVGVRFLVDKLVQKFIQSQPQQEPEFDVYITSSGDMTQEKMKLLNELWKNGIRAEVDYNCNSSHQDPVKHCQDNNIRFLVTFKQTVFSNNRKVKLRDGKEIDKKKIESEEDRDNIVDVLMERLYKKEKERMHL